jgi:hypothetical protein
VGKPAQLCFDVMALRITGPGQQIFLDFIFYALDVKKVVFLVHATWTQKSSI